MTTLQLLLALFAALSLADIWTTREFRRLGIAEANKWLDRAMGRHGFDELYLAKYVGFLFVLIPAGQGWLSAWPVALICAIQAGVVAWNLYRINQRRNDESQS